MIELQTKGTIAVETYLTLAEFKAKTILDLPDYSDPVLQKFINRAQSMADSWLGGNIGYSSHCDKDIRCIYDYPRNGLSIQLPRRPIDRITKIEVTFDANSSLTWDTVTKLDNWKINNAVGYLDYSRLSVGNYALNVCVRDPLASNITPTAEVTYYSGYKVIPEDVKIAMTTFVEQLIRIDRGDDLEVTSVFIGNYREGFKRSKGIKSVGVIGGTDQVERLLRKYRQPSETMFTGGPLG